MTVKGNEIPITQLIFTALLGCCTLIFAIGAWFMRDIADSVRSLREDMAVVKLEVRTNHEEAIALRSDQDDLRLLLYKHMGGK